MAIVPAGQKLVLDPADEYCHEPESAQNYNESMYFNVFDADQKIGGWMRLGNRVHEGHAEMSVCLYLPDGRVGFAYARPRIEHNREMNAGGLRIEVVEPFRRLRVHYEGPVLLLKNPLEMAEPSCAFKNNPLEACLVDLDYEGVSPMYGGRAVHEDGSDIELDSEKSFARAHYEQHMKATGTIEVAGHEWTVAGLGLRDKSWGPRYWQAIHWYRWLPMSFTSDFGMMISVIAGEDGRIRRSGMVLRDGQYAAIRDARVESVWDRHGYQTSVRAWARTDEREYTVEGRVISMIPLRNRRKRPDGGQMLTRITEGMTEYRCDGKIGYGLSEYLDQIVDGQPVGRDAV
ncbi:MAG TPA: hypothetical protein VEL28_21145 [Candidatus Binatia bacterium]|nr:hypothetical protein [Candidatus Binatia bacterium]